MPGPRPQQRWRRGYLKAGTVAHGVKQQRHASAAIGTFAECVIDLSRGNDRVRVGPAHPVNRGSDVVI